MSKQWGGTEEILETNKFSSCWLNPVDPPRPSQLHSSPRHRGSWKGWSPRDLTPAWMPNTVPWLRLRLLFAEEANTEKSTGQKKSHFTLRKPATRGEGGSLCKRTNPQHCKAQPTFIQGGVQETDMGYTLRVLET